MDIDKILREFKNNDCKGLKSETWDEILNSNNEQLIACLADIKNFESNLRKLQ